MTTTLHKVVGLIDVSSMSLEDLRPEDLGLMEIGPGWQVEQADGGGASSEQVAACRVGADIAQLANELQGELVRYERKAAMSMRRRHPR
jgi:hypothetical protein